MPRPGPASKKSSFREAFRTFRVRNVVDICSESFSFLKSLHVLHPPYFFFTRCIGLAHGLLDGHMIPCSSKKSISVFAARNFSPDNLSGRFATGCPVVNM